MFKLKIRARAVLLALFCVLGLAACKTNKKSNPNPPPEGTYKLTVPVQVQTTDAYGVYKSSLSALTLGKLGASGSDISVTYFYVDNTHHNVGKTATLPISITDGVSNPSMELPQDASYAVTAPSSLQVGDATCPLAAGTKPNPPQARLTKDFTTAPFIYKCPAVKPKTQTLSVKITGAPSNYHQMPNITFLSQTGDKISASGVNLNSPFSVDGFKPGNTYNVSATSITDSTDGDVYTAKFAPETITVTAGKPLAQEVITYTQSPVKTKTLSVTVKGLPAGVPLPPITFKPGSDATITVPKGSAASFSVKGFIPGDNYTINAPNVSYKGTDYTASYNPKTIDGNSFPTEGEVITYNAEPAPVKTKSLSLVVKGLPAGVTLPAITFTPGSGAKITVPQPPTSASATIVRVPGFVTGHAYTVYADPFTDTTTTGAKYVVSSYSDTSINVTADSTLKETINYKKSAPVTHNVDFSFTQASDQGQVAALQKEVDLVDTTDKANIVKCSSLSGSHNVCTSADFVVGQSYSITNTLSGYTISVNGSSNVITISGSGKTTATIDITKKTPPSVPQVTFKVSNTDKVDLSKASIQLGTLTADACALKAVSESVTCQFKHAVVGTPYKATVSGLDGATATFTPGSYTFKTSGDAKTGSLTITPDFGTEHVKVTVQQASQATRNADQGALYSSTGGLPTPADFQNNFSLNSVKPDAGSCVVGSSSYGAGVGDNSEVMDCTFKSLAANIEYTYAYTVPASSGQVNAVSGGDTYTFNPPSFKTGITATPATTTMTIPAPKPPQPAPQDICKLHKKIAQVDEGYGQIQIDQVLNGNGDVVYDDGSGDSTIHRGFKVTLTSVPSGVSTDSTGMKPSGNNSFTANKSTDNIKYIAINFHGDVTQSGIKGVKLSCKFLP